MMEMEQKLTLVLPEFIPDLHEYKKQISQAIIEYINKVSKIVLHDLYQIGLDALKQDWDEMMRQYYLYRTKRYRRIGAGVGTGSGVNLYNAFHYDLGEDYCKVYFDTQLMQPHKQILDGGTLDEEELLDFIMDGNRSIFPMTAQNHLRYDPSDEEKYPPTFRVDITDNVIGFSANHCTPNEVIGKFQIQWQKFQPKKYDELIDKYMHMR